MNNRQSIFILGKGGREAAIHHFLIQNNPNLEIKKIKDISEVNLESLATPSFFIIGPEAPLVAGIADLLRQRGHVVFGPSQEAALLEGSKLFAKRFMLKAQVPTARHVVVQSVQDVMDALHKNDFFSAPYILKADGLAGGKGVFICKTKQELLNNANLLFEQKILGDAGKTALLEERLDGYEMSVLVLTNGKEFQILPVAQDHKRLSDNDQGPNTGGMGTTAPYPVHADLMESIINDVVAPSVAQLEKEKLLFRGVLFIGLMIVDQSPYILEYNVRFGDPETQSVLPLIQMDNPVDLFLSIAQGQIPSFKIKTNTHSCCVVIAAENYPDQPKLGAPIHFSNLTRSNQMDELYSSTDNKQNYVLLAGTQNKDQQVLVNGGRVLNCLGTGKTLEEARANAYALTKQIHFTGMQNRTDIGKPRI